MDSFTYDDGLISHDDEISHLEKMVRNRLHATPQPSPSGNGQPVSENLILFLQGRSEEIFDVTTLSFLVTAIKERSEFGLKKYGTVLKTNNGRDSLVDLWQELVDALQYSFLIYLEEQTIVAYKRVIKILNVCLDVGFDVSLANSR